MKNSSKGQRRKISPEEKVKILRRHLVEKVPVSDLCDEYGIQPANFYQWQKVFFDHGSNAFSRGGGTAGGSAKKDDERVRKLEEKLQKKNEILSEVMEEHVRLKKEFGEI